MGNATIALYTGITAPLVPEDAESVTVAGIPTVRQRNQVAGAGAADIAVVMATTPAGTEMGLVMRLAGPIPAGSAAIGKLAANSGVDIGDVDVLSLVPGTSQTALGKAIDVAAGANDTGVAMLAVRRDALVTLTPADGDWVPILVNSFGSQWVSLDHMPQVIGSVAHGSPDTQFPVKIGGYASAALRAAVSEGDRTDASFTLLGQLRVTSEGQVAHDGVDLGSPLKMGFRALAHGTNPTAVAAADRTDWLANRAGVPWVMGGHPNIVTIEAAFTAAQTDAALVTIGAGLKIVVTQVAAICDNANTVNVAVRIGFGTATTPTTTGVVLTHPGIPAGSGYSRGDGSGMLGVGADNEDLRITCSVPTTGSVRALVSYYTIES